MRAFRIGSTKESLLYCLYVQVRYLFHSHHGKSLYSPHHNPRIDAVLPQIYSSCLWWLTFSFQKRVYDRILVSKPARALDLAVKPGSRTLSPSPHGKFFVRMFMKGYSVRSSIGPSWALCSQCSDQSLQALTPEIIRAGMTMLRASLSVHCAVYIASMHSLTH